MALLKRFQHLAVNTITFSNVFWLYLSRFSHIKVRILRLWNGAVFHVDNLNNNLGTVIEVFYAREYRDLEELIDRKDATFIDIGANIGTFTIWALRTVPGSRVFSYEPETKNYSLLVENIRDNGMERRAQAFRSAVCGESGMRSLSIAGESSGKNSLAYDVGGVVSEQVSCLTLASIFADNGITHCDCLKVDCEGAEYELLYAAPVSVTNMIDMIIFESHGVEGHCVGALKKFLVERGFTIEDSLLFASMHTARKVKVQ